MSSYLVEVKYCGYLVKRFVQVTDSVDDAIAEIKKLPEFPSPTELQTITVSEIKP